MLFNALKGYNVTILAYGQTSSGKTHTISGNSESPGLIVLAANTLFKNLQYLVTPEGINAMPAPHNNEVNFTDRSTRVTISYLEIYNENVNDLLDGSKRNLEVRENKSGDVLVEGLTLKTVTCQEEFMECLREGESVRMFAETRANTNSSRSHAIFRIQVEIVDINTETGRRSIRTSQINLVDLAGSEGASKTRSEGVRLREGGNINKSLLALSNVIHKLSQRQQISGKHNYYINFRDSKLTRILQNALSGQSQISIICCINQLT
jgi:centromeric protein E